MKPLLETMREQERRNLWSERWLIASAFLQGAVVVYLALGQAGRARLPAWLFWVWAVLALLVATLAAIAKTMQPKDGMLDLPLGRAYVPTMPALRPPPPAAPAPAAPEGEDTPAPEK